MRCLTSTALSTLGGRAHTFFFTISLCHLILESKTFSFSRRSSDVLASVARTPLERFARTPLVHMYECSASPQREPAGATMASRG